MNKVLIVDDNPSDLKILNMLLEKKGFDVTQASDAYSAIEMMAENKFDLVFLDWMMPKVNGLEILRTIRSRTAFKKIPVIFVTSKSETRDIKKAIDEGITDYLIKPLDPMILESKVAKILKRDDAWRMSEVPEALSGNSIMKVSIQIVGISEIAIQIKSTNSIPTSEILNVESEFLKKIGIPEVQIRIHECQPQQNGFIIVGILIGMKESELKEIRKFVNATIPARVSEAQ